jgi:hypothetical protein
MEERIGCAMSEERTSNFFPVNSAAVVALLTGFFLVVPASDESNSPNVPANSSAALPENGDDNPRTLSQTVLHAPPSPMFVLSRQGFGMTLLRGVMRVWKI